MTPEKLFHELLGLGLNWEVSESRFERESGTVFLEIRETLAAVGIGALSQRRRAGLLLRPHGSADLAPPQCLPTPL